MTTVSMRELALFTSLVAQRSKAMLDWGCLKIGIVANIKNTSTNRVRNDKGCMQNCITNLRTYCLVGSLVALSQIEKSIDNGIHD